MRQEDRTRQQIYAAIEKDRRKGTLNNDYRSKLADYHFRRKPYGKWDESAQPEEPEDHDYDW